MHTHMNVHMHMYTFSYMLTHTTYSETTSRFLISHLSITHMYRCTNLHTYIHNMHICISIYNID